MILSIKKRFLVIFLSLLVAMVTITVSKIYFDAKKQLQALFDAEIAQSARLLLTITVAELNGLLDMDNTNESIKIQRTILKNLHKYQKRILFQIWSDNDTIAVRSGDAPDEPLVTTDNEFSDKILGGEKWRVFSVVDEQANIRVQVGHRYEQRNTLMKIIFNQLLSSILLLLPLFAVIIFISVNKALKPLNNMARHIQLRALNSLEPISMTQVPQEVRTIVSALNSLFERLQIAVNDIIVFTANAAHELRTPLTTQKLHAQIALEALDEADKKAALKEVIAGVNRSTLIVEQLLQLARLDPEAEVSMLDEANISRCAQDTIADLVPLALARNIDIGLDVDDNLSICGKQSLLSILIRNLVENAIRYNKENGKVDITIKQTDEAVHLQVSDSGPGIPKAERENVFKRFYRGELNEDQEGTGLGLAMVQRITQIHQAQIKLSESKFQGLQVDVYFKPANGGA